MAATMYRMAPDALASFMQDVFAGLGVPSEQAKTCADVLMAADLRGIDSHGVNRLKPIYYDRIRAGIQEPVTHFEIVRESPTTAVIDGHNGMGMVIAKRSMQMAMDRATRFGMGMVAVRNSTHYGIAGYYALMAADHDMIGITGTNARPSGAPTFSVDNLLGTNPLTFGMPTDEDFPFLLDCATAITQRGKIEVMAREGKPVPEGLVIGRDGHCLTDAKAILHDLTTGDAALLPLGGPGEVTGGYKGYGYATVVELLSAALQGGSYLTMLSGFDEQGNRIPYPLGHFFIAINVAAFTEPAAFRATAGNILRALRAGRLAPGCEHIYTAGEKEHMTHERRSREGIPLAPSLQAEMIQMRDELGLSHHVFPFA